MDTPLSRTARRHPQHDYPDEVAACRVCMARFWAAMQKLRALDEAGRLPQ